MKGCLMGETYHWQATLATSNRLVCVLQSVTQHVLLLSFICQVSKYVDTVYQHGTVLTYRQAFKTNQNSIEGWKKNLNKSQVQPNSRNELSELYFFVIVSTLFNHWFINWYNSFVENFNSISFFLSNQELIYLS